MDFYSKIDSRLLDRQTPTLFEILSADELEKLLSPSVRFILAHYANRYPRYLIKILNHFDTLNLAVRGAIEYRFLSTWNSTFIEKFYGLKRVKKSNLELPKGGAVSGKVESLRRLGKLQIFGSLLDLLLVPYIKEKLDLLYEKLLPTFMLNRIQPKRSIKEFFRYAFMKLYPTIVMACKIVDIVFKVLFISGRLKGTTLLQYLFKMEYSRFNQYDYTLDEHRVSRFLSKRPSADGVPERVRPESLTDSILQVCSSAALPLKRVALVTSNSVLPASIFLLKFLEWWNSSEMKKSFGKEEKEKKTPSRPDLLRPSLGDSEVKDLIVTQDSLCRICHQEIHNPAIIETGFVFCYPCIYNYLRDRDKETGGRCPITGRKLLGCKYSDSQKEWKVTGIRRLVI